MTFNIGWAFLFLISENKFNTCSTHGFSELQTEISNELGVQFPQFDKLWKLWNLWKLWKTNATLWKYFTLLP